MDFVTWKKTIRNPDQEFQSESIESLLLEKGSAKLYNDETLNYGELFTVDEFGDQKSFFFVIASLNVLHYDRRISSQEKRSVQAALGPVSDDVRNYKVAFFSESSQLLQTIR